MSALLSYIEVTGLYADYDGILGVRLRHRFTEYSIGIMGNYLSPSKGACTYYTINFWTILDPPPPPPPASSTSSWLWTPHPPKMMV